MIKLNARIIVDKKLPVFDLDETSFTRKLIYKNADVALDIRLDGGKIIKFGIKRNISSSKRLYRQN